MLHLIEHTFFYWDFFNTLVNTIKLIFFLRFIGHSKINRLLETVEKVGCSKQFLRDAMNIKSLRNTLTRKTNSQDRTLYCPIDKAYQQYLGRVNSNKKTSKRNMKELLLNHMNKRFDGEDEKVCSFYLNKYLI